jgi:hypothetical protein
MTLLCVAVYNLDIGAYHSSHEEFEDAKGAIRIHISKKNRQLQDLINEGCSYRAEKAVHVFHGLRVVKSLVKLSCIKLGC